MLEEFRSYTEVLVRGVDDENLQDYTIVSIKIQ